MFTSPPQTTTCCCWTGGFACPGVRRRTATVPPSIHSSGPLPVPTGMVSSVSCCRVHETMGAAGLMTIVDRGGLAVIQDPEDSLHPSMPRRAQEMVPNAVVRPVAKIGALLGELVREPRKTAHNRGRTHNNALSDAEVDMADMVPISTADLPIEPAGFGCPTCGGSLFEVAGSPVPRYRCRVGHAWSPESLLEEQANALESALWMALRALEEKSALSRRMARTREALGNAALASRYDDAADESARAGLLIRDLIASMGVTDVGDAADRVG
jgi:two-component system chemotaxis response regulator CheB